VTAALQVDRVRVYTRGALVERGHQA
jgi:hypothetical protein